MLKLLHLPSSTYIQRIEFRSLKYFFDDWLTDETILWNWEAFISDFIPARSGSQPCIFFTDASWTIGCNIPDFEIMEIDHDKKEE